jgi:hypothetical protein
LLEQLQIERIPRLIEGPAAIAGFNVERGLSEAMSRDVDGPQALPLLAQTLWLLYCRGLASKNLAIAAYQALGMHNVV